MGQGCLLELEKVPMKYFFRTFVTLLPGFSFLPRRTVSPDRSRRDAILNVLLISSCCALFLVFSILVVAQISNYVAGYEIIPPVLPFALLTLCVFLVFLTRRGYGIWASWIFLGLSFIFPAYISVVYGASIPQSLLTYALVIVMAGILINSTSSFFVTVGLIIFISGLMYLQQIGIVQANTIWRNYQPNIGNTIAYNLSFSLIAIVSWLFNKHSERALEQARIFEAALKQERDQLEQTVYQKTQQLRKAQVDRLRELQKFATFGRQATGFLHDLANPLQVISLSLEEVNQQRTTNKKAFGNMNMAIRDAITATHKIEEYIISTRSILQNEEIRKKFSLLKEVNQAMKILSPRARTLHVDLDLQAEEKTYLLTGNNIKLHQVVSNFIANALDAYEANPDFTHREVILRVDRDELYVILTIEDFAGGIKPAISEHMFEPFFSTKNEASHLGIGLAMCKTIIEQDFGGKIHYERIKENGSRFVISFLQT